MPRSSSIVRHFALVADLLRGGTHDRHSLAAKLAIKPAMADRLMRAAVEEVPGVRERRDGRIRSVYFDPSTLMPPPSYPTAVAACFGASVAPLFAGTSYGPGIQRALADVIGRTRRRAVFRDIDRKFWFLRRGGESALEERAPLLDEAIEAVLHHHAILVRYTRFGGSVEALRLEPLSIVVHDHQLYVVARSEGGLHPYRFSRITSVEVLPETFRYPARAEYHPDRVFKHSFGIFLDRPIADVELRLDPQWATYAATHRWHDSQRVTVRPDRVLLRLRVRVCPELEAWIMGFGEQAEVLAPRELRQRVAARLASASRAYRR